MHRLVHRGLHARRAAHAARRRADARAPAAEHRLRRPLRHPHARPRSSTLARTRSTADRPIRVLAELKHPGWSTEHGLPMAELVADGAAPAGRHRRRRARSCCSPSSPPCCATCARPLGDDGPQMVQLVDDGADGDRMVTPAGLREISTYAQGIGPSRDRVLLGDDAAARVDVRAGRRRRTAPRWRSSAGRCGRRTPSCPRTCAVGDAPGGLGDAARRGPPAADLGVDGLITDSPDHAVQRREGAPRRGLIPLLECSSAACGARSEPASARSTRKRCLSRSGRG